MLVRSGLKENLIAVFSFKPGDAVRQNRLIGIPDMGLAGGIGPPSYF